MFYIVNHQRARGWSTEQVSHQYIDSAAPVVPMPQCKCFNNEDIFFQMQKPLFKFSVVKPACWWLKGPKLFENFSPEIIYSDIHKP